MKKQMITMTIGLLFTINTSGATSTTGGAKNVTTPVSVSVITPTTIDLVFEKYLAFKEDVLNQIEAFLQQLMTKYPEEKLIKKCDKVPFGARIRYQNTLRGKNPEKNEFDCYILEEKMMNSVNILAPNPEKPKYLTDLKNFIRKLVAQNPDKLWLLNSTEDRVLPMVDETLVMADNPDYTKPKQSDLSKMVAWEAPLPQYRLMLKKPTKEIYLKEGEDQ